MTASRRVVRVLLADDHALVRAGVRKILEAEPGVRVVGEVGDGDAVLAELERSEAELLVLDLSMPGRDGLQVLAEAKRRRPGLKVLVLTMHAGAEYVARAVREGADGYLLKDSAVRDLVAAIGAVMAGQAFFSPPAQRAISDGLRATRPLDALTDREREVLRAVAEGLASKEIATRLGIGVRTVESHRASLMRKLAVNSVARLTQLAIREGLLGQP